MRVKRISTIFLLVLLFALCSCAAEGENITSKISPADLSLIELASQVYRDPQLLDIIQFGGSIEKLDVKYPVECIREADGKYRVSYLGVEKVAILVFDAHGNKLTGRIYHPQRVRSDFAQLANGHSLEAVQKMDPQGEYLFLFTGRNDTPRVSRHYTRDGYIITIEYDASDTIIAIKEEWI